MRSRLMLLEFQYVNNKRIVFWFKREEAAIGSLFIFRHYLILSIFYFASGALGV